MKINTVKTNISLQKKGYSLIEVLLVTVIIMISFTALFGFSASVIKSDTESRNEVLAANLAQEGLEMVRNIRDSDMLALTDPSDWRDNLPSGSNYMPSINSNGKVTLANAGDASVYYDSSTGGRYYNCAASCSGLKTSFRRSITVTQIDANKLQITSDVKWYSATNSSLERSVSAQAILTSWDQN